RQRHTCLLATRSLQQPSRHQQLGHLRLHARLRTIALEKHYPLVARPRATEVGSAVRTDLDSWSARRTLLHSFVQAVEFGWLNSAAVADAHPIGLVETFFDAPVKAGIGPGVRAPYQAVLDGI